MRTVYTKLPLKPVDLPALPGKVNLYAHNKRRLSNIPSLFTGFLAGTAIAIALLIFNPFGIGTLVTNTQDQAASVSPTDRLQTVIQNQPVNPQTAVIVPVKATQTNNPSLTVGEADQTCNLNYQTQAPQSLELGITKSIQGFWLPGECHDTHLLAIQIVRLQAEELSSLQERLGTSQVQLLDQTDTYALVYTLGQAPFPILLERYVQDLTSPVFQDRYYFNPLTALESKRIGNYNYYLDGRCYYNQTVGSCKLWRVGVLTGKVEFLKNQVAQTGIGMQYELKEGDALHFAQEQDFAAGLNLVLLNQQRKDQYRLLGLTQSDWEIKQDRVITVDREDFRVYFK